MIFEHGHALIVGVGGNLPETINDAKAIADILKNEEICAYPPKQVTLLTGSETTRDRILTALEDLAKIDEEATVVVYYSGHGGFFESRDGREYFLVPHGFEQTDLSGTAIKGDEFNGALSRIRSKKRLVLLDCCHATGVLPASVKSAGVSKKSNEVDLQFVKSAMPIEAHDKLNRGVGQVVINSSLATEYSFGGSPYSAFTSVLLQAFRGVGASRNDGFVRTSDLAGLTRQEIPRLTRYRQTPTSDYFGADNFAVSYYAGGDPHAKGLPAELTHWKPDEDRQPPPPPPDKGSSITKVNFLKFAHTVHGALTKELAASGVPEIFIPYEFDSEHPYRDGWYVFLYSPLSPLNEQFESDDSPFFYALRVEDVQGQGTRRAAIVYAYCILETRSLITSKNLNKVEMRQKLIDRLNKDAKKTREILPATFTDNMTWFACGQQRIGAFDAAAVDLVVAWFRKQIPVFEQDVRRFLANRR